MEASEFSSLLPEEPTLETAGNDQKTLGKIHNFNELSKVNWIILYNNILFIWTSINLINNWEWMLIY